MNHHTESRSWQEKTSRLHVADGSLRNRAQGHQKNIKMESARAPFCFYKWQTWDIGLQNYKLGMNDPTIRVGCARRENLPWTQPDR